jgi:hypothetical protein
MRLNLFRKPTVAFDATNQKHRADYATFLKTNSWKHSDVHYELADVAGEVQGVVQRKLLEYYSSKEFSKVWSTKSCDTMTN